MKNRSSIRDSSFLMVGVGTVVIFSALIFVNSDEEGSSAFDEVPMYSPERTLLDSEFKRLLSHRLITADIRIAIGEDLSSAAVAATKELGFLWGAQADWSTNQGIPPPGVILVDEVIIEGDSGLVSTVIGERASSLACGISIDSEYDWAGQWGHRQSRLRMC